MCIWTQSNYTGAIEIFSSTGSYLGIDLSTARSAYNNRSKRTYLNRYSDGSGSYSCFGPGDSDSALTNWQLSAEAVYLSTYTNC